MTECILIFETPVSQSSVESALSDLFPAVLPVFSTSFQIGADASYSEIIHALRTSFPESRFAIAKVKSGKTNIYQP